MDFREEYKKSAEVMTPSAEAMERMTKNIMEQVNAPTKKAIPFKKISYIGGAVAACAVITVGAVKFLPSMQSEIATADAALTNSAAAMCQESAVAEDEYTPLNGVRAEADNAFDTKTDYVMDAAEGAVSENESIFDYAGEAGNDTAAIVVPSLSENEDVALPSDKTFAEDAPTAAADSAAPEGVMEEADVAIDNVADESCQKHETTDTGINAEAVPECSTEIIYVTDDMQSFTIGDTEYFMLPWHNGTITEKSIAYYTGSDGKLYEVIDSGDIVVLIHGDYRGFYCTADMYDYMISYTDKE